MDHSGAIIQFGSVAISLGGFYGILRSLAPHLIRLYFEHKAENIEKEHQNLKLAADNEMLRKRNADLEIGRIEAMLSTTKLQIEGLQKGLSANDAMIQELSVNLRHTDEGLAKFAAYVPALERIKEILEKADKRRNGSTTEEATAAPRPRSGFPEQEHIQIGPDTKIIRDRKPGPTGGSK